MLFTKGPYSAIKEYVPTFCGSVVMSGAAMVLKMYLVQSCSSLSHQSCSSLSHPVTTQYITTYIHAYIHTQIYTHIYTCIHIHTHTHTTHTHTQTQHTHTTHTQRNTQGYCTLLTILHCSIFIRVRKSDRDSVSSLLSFMVVTVNT